MPLTERCTSCGHPVNPRIRHDEDGRCIGCVRRDTAPLPHPRSAASARAPRRPASHRTGRGRAAASKTTTKKRARR